jgi:ATP-binding protein involved in chromosome partitioning
MFEQVHIPVIGIVENMSYFICSNCSERHDIFGSGGGEELSRRFKTRLLGQIPLSTEIRKGGDAGVPIVVGAPDSPQGIAFKEIAESVVRQVALDASKGSGLPVLDMSDSRGDSFTV